MAKKKPSKPSKPNAQAEPESDDTKLLADDTTLPALEADGELTVGLPPTGEDAPSDFPHVEPLIDPSTPGNSGDVVKALTEFVCTPPDVIHVPLVPLPETGYLNSADGLPRKVEARLCTPVQRETLRRVQLALKERHAQLALGTHVENHADVIRWLLEQIASMGESLPEVEG